MTPETIRGYVEMMQKNIGDFKNVGIFI